MLGRDRDAIVDLIREEETMATIPHEPPALVRRPAWIEARNLWASLAVTAMWLTVLFTAMFGPDFETVSAGGDHVTIPSAIGVAFFVMFATIAVAKYGFDKSRDS
jgi:hypothetical protein